VTAKPGEPGVLGEPCEKSPFTTGNDEGDAPSHKVLKEHQGHNAEVSIFQLLNGRPKDALKPPFKATGRLSGKRHEEVDSILNQPPLCLSRRGIAGGAFGDRERR
jgi:hypothetical protein